jgi:hypothetical protein
MGRQKFLVGLIERKKLQKMHAKNWYKSLHIASGILYDSDARIRHGLSLNSTFDIFSFKIFLLVIFFFLSTEFMPFIYYKKKT